MSGRSRGAALLAAMLLVALATAIAYAIAFDTGLSLRRAAGSDGQDQAQLVAGGAEQIAAEILVRDRRSGSTHPAQDWARPLGPLEVAPDATVAAQLEDLQGRFNLNTLVDAQGKADPVAIEIFGRLLTQVGLEPRFASLLADWIDSDDQPLDANGAEDAVYSSRQPPYRTPNQPLTSASELLALADFGYERYLRIAPFVVALPRSTPLNLCSAPGAVLDALTGEDQWTRAPDALRRNRERGCFPTREAFRAQFADGARHARIVASIGVTEQSDYFALRTRVAVGSTRYSLYSLLLLENRSGPSQARVLARRFAE